MKFYHVILLLTMPLLSAEAADITFFSALTEGPDAWVWDGAKVKSDDGRLIIREGNRSASFGNVYVASKFPYFGNGRISYSIGAASGGNYSLQVLFFKGLTYISSADLVKKATSPKTAEVALSDLQVPEGCDGLSFKIWIADLEGAQVELQDLSYSVPMGGREVMMDDQFMRSAAWKLDGLVWKASGPPAVVGLNDVGFGSMLSSQRMVKSSGITAAVHIPRLEAGVITLQAVGFEAETGEYIDSADLLKNVGAGWHLVNIDYAQWPAQADEFELKLWLAGTAKTSATLGRILVLR